MAENNSLALKTDYRDWVIIERNGGVGPHFFGCSKVW